MEYKLFSSNTQWLPVAPPEKLDLSIAQDLNDILNNNNSLLANIELPANALLGGNEAIYTALNLNGVEMHKATAEQAALINILNQQGGVIHKLGDKLSMAAVEQVLRMANQEVGIFDPRSYNKRLAVELEGVVNAKQTTKTGFIIWLRTTSKKEGKKKKADKAGTTSTPPPHSVGVVEVGSGAVVAAAVCDIMPKQLSPKSVIEKIVENERREALRKEEEKRTRKKAVAGQQGVSNPPEEVSFVFLKVISSFLLFYKKVPLLLYFVL